jgi:hypothetical protein
VSAPTDRFLDVLAERFRPKEDPVPPGCSPEFLAQETVQRYAGSLDDLTEPERDRRLAALEEFSKFVEREPDRMVEEIYNRETRKYRKRGFYSDNAKAFAAQLEGPEHQRLARSNVIRAFFIANGFRLPPERPSWMS